MLLICCCKFVIGFVYVCAENSSEEHMDPSQAAENVELNARIPEEKETGSLVFGTSLPERTNLDEATGEIEMPNSSPHEGNHLKILCFPNFLHLFLEKD